MAENQMKDRIVEELKKAKEVGKITNDQYFSYPFWKAIKGVFIK